MKYWYDHWSDQFDDKFSSSQYESNQCALTKEESGLKKHVKRGIIFFYIFKNVIIASP